MNYSFIKKTITTGMLFAFLTGCASSHSCTSEKRHYYRHNRDEIPQHILCKSKYVELTGKQFDRTISPKDAKEMLSTCRDANLTCLVATIERRILNIPAAIFGFKKAGEYETAALLSEERAQEEAKKDNLTERIHSTAEARQHYKHAFQKYFEDDKCNTCALRIAEQLKDQDLITKTKSNLLRESEKYRDFFYAAELSQQLGDLERALWNHETSEDFFSLAPEFALTTGDIIRAVHHHEQHTAELSEQLKTLAQTIPDPTELTFAKKELTHAVQEHQKKSALLYNLYAHTAEAQGNFLLALPYFEQTENWSRATHCAEKANLYGKAITYYHKSGERNHAHTARWNARRYISRIAEEGDFTKAADVAEQIKDHTLAATLRAHAEKANRYFQKD